MQRFILVGILLTGVIMVAPAPENIVPISQAIAADPEEVAAKPATPLESTVRSVIQNQMDVLRTQRGLQIRGSGIVAGLVLPIFYEGREYRPAWIGPELVSDLKQVIRSATHDGLDPLDYHLAAIVDLAGRQDPAAVANLDILCTDALLCLAYHLTYGKVDPERLDPHWNIYGETLELPQVLQWLKDVLASGDILPAMAKMRRSQPIYRDLVTALVAYQEIQQTGGWAAVSSGPTLRPGMSDPRVASLRERLSVTRDLASDPPAGTPAPRDSDLYAGDLASAVKRFQVRHGLDADGLCGQQTLAALNVPVAERIDQIRVNLERLRWVLQDTIRKFVVVNIADYKVFFLQEGNAIWETRAQVGTQYRQTPVFRADMKYLVFNPTWTVPPTILREDILPRARQNPSYLTEQRISVIDRQGWAIAPEQVDWQGYTGNDFPYTLRQEPGSQNALGRVKFIFPNKHFVFLHDTPSRALFNRSQRAFSSGCIRVAEPLILAEKLLDDPENWNLEQIEKLVASGRTQTVHLREPVPVLLMYWTAFALREGEVHFRQDIYGRDAAILQDLDSGFQARARHVRGVQPD